MREKEIEFLTTQEVCELLRVPKQTISRWIKAGTIPAIRLGPRQLRFPKAELLAWLDSQRVDR